LHAGDARTIPAFSLTVGSESTTVTVNAAAEMIPTENGQRTDVIDQKQIENLALEGRDTTGAASGLPGATTVSSGLTENARCTTISTLRSAKRHRQRHRH